MFSFFFLETKTLRGIFLASCRFGRDVTTLEKEVQPRVARFVKGDYKREFSVTLMMCDLRWQSLEAHRAFRCLPPMYNTGNGLVDVESQVLVKSEHGIRQWGN